MMHIHPHPLSKDCHCAVCRPLERPCGCTSCSALRALRWYEEKVAECRKIGSLGDNARQALDRDGGFRARDALSQQAEPADMATAAAQGFRDGQAAVEPAAAQDERECETGGTVSELLAAIMHFGSEKWAEGRGAADPELANVRAAWDSVYSLVQDLATRPAQTEQQPLFFINPLVIDELKGKRKPSPGGLTWSRTACGHWTFAVYAAPVAQTEQPTPDGCMPWDDPDTYGPS